MRDEHTSATWAAVAQHDSGQVGIGQAPQREAQRRPRRRSHPISHPHQPVGPHPSHTPSHPHTAHTTRTTATPKTVSHAGGLEGLDVFGDTGDTSATTPPPTRSRARAKKTLGDATGALPAVTVDTPAASSPAHSALRQRRASGGGEDTGVLPTSPAKSRAPRAKFGASSASSASSTPSASGASAQIAAAPRRYETAELPALDDAPDTSGMRAGRRATTARPLTNRDTAMMTRTTQMLAVVSQLGDNPITLTSPTAEERALRQEPVRAGALVAAPDAATRRVTLVPGSTTAQVQAIVLPPRRKRRPLTVMTSWALAITTVLAVITTGGVLWATHHAPSHFMPAGAPYALNPANQPPTGAWSASAGFSPNAEIGGGAGPSTKAPGSAGLPAKSPTHKSSPTPGGQGVIASPPFYPWPPTYAFAAVPGYYAFRMSGPPGNFYYWAFGQCTWWAQYERRGENLMHMGNARYWGAVAAGRGYRVGSRPQAGATVVFQPGVQGAGGAGHVAHVVKVYPNGWFLVSEMNFYWNGGGWARVDYRLAHAGWGVSFIY
ncbi:MAG: CHAP domain-containing protein [Ktedonobacterales bacterium]